MIDRHRSRTWSLAVIAWFTSCFLASAGCDADAPESDPAQEVAASRVETPAPTAAEAPRALAVLPVEAAPAAAVDADAETVAADPASPPPKPVLKPAPKPAPIDRATETLTTLLAEVVTADGLVRYDQLKQVDHAMKLATVVDELARARKPEGRENQLALWCNAYNANVLALVLRERRNPGFTTAVKVDGFFDKFRFTVAGESITLNDLENKRIRPIGDPRIHAALVCAAVSCPPLRNEAYVAARIDEQLDDQCHRWVNDSKKFRMENGSLGVSQILKWYGDDFTSAPYSSPTGFVLAYADPAGAIARYIVNEEEPRLTWLEYDWTLNDAAVTKEASGG